MGHRSKQPADRRKTVLARSLRIAPTSCNQRLNKVVRLCTGLFKPPLARSQMTNKQDLPTDVFTDVLKSMKHLLDDAARAFTGPAEQFRQLEESIQKAMKDPIRRVLHDLQRQQEQLHKIFKEADRALRETESDVRLLAQCGWTLPLWGGLDFAVKTMDAAGRHPPDEAELDAAFEEHYTANNGTEFNTMATELLSSEGLAPWRPMLTECVSAYRRNEFNVPTPALFSVLDGAAITVGGMPNSTNPIRPMRAATEAAKHTIELLILTSLTQFLTVYFCDAPFSGEEPHRPNRHWVLHGRSRRQFTRVDCIRLFHALHTLSHEIEV